LTGFACGAPLPFTNLPTAAGTLATAGWTAAEKTFCGKKCRPFVKIM
jgi:hypothetical protein